MRRGLKGEGCQVGASQGHRKTTTLTEVSHLTNMRAQLILDGAMNGVAFLANVEHVLFHTLSPGDIIVMDYMPATMPKPQERQ